MRSIGRVALLGALVLGAAWFLQRGDIAGSEGSGGDAVETAESEIAASQQSARPAVASSPDAVQEAFEDRAQGRQLRVSG
ncbi:MAG: hypothetical protein ABW051_01135, partial [Burkholderiaceae bacterium]